MKNKKHPKIYIDILIAFLNSESPWEALAFSRRENKSFHAKTKIFQYKLRHEISDALTPPRTAALKRLVHELERTDVAAWLDFDVAGSNDEGNLLDFGDEKLRVFKKWKSKTPEQEIYSYLYLAIESGEFSLIKKCRQCPKFFVSYRHDARACSPKCNRDYHNDERKRSGYFRDKYDATKELKLKKARSLKSKKTPRFQIIEKSGLTEKMLIREGILEVAPI
jgi:hypothetical protein